MEFEKNLRALVAKLKQNGSPLLWTGLLPATPKPEAKPPAREPEADIVPNVSIAKDATPLTTVAEDVMKEYGLTPDPVYAETMAAHFAPGGKPAERVITQTDWIQCAEWLADSLARQMKAAHPAPPPAP